MMRRAWACLLLAGLAPVVSAQTTVSQPLRPAIVQTEEKKSLDFADSLFEDKQPDYARALAEYRRFVDKFPQSASREAAGRRNAVCL